MAKYWRPLDWLPKPSPNTPRHFAKLARAVRVSINKNGSFASIKPESKTTMIRIHKIGFIAMLLASTIPLAARAQSAARFRPGHSMDRYIQPVVAPQSMKKSVANDSCA